MRVWALALLLLAGCAGPPVPPEDAVTDTVDGLVLSAWTDVHGDRVRLHGLLHNEGRQTFEIRYGCGEPWNSTLVAPDGSHVPYRQVMEDPKCPVLWDKIPPRGHIDTLYSWDFHAHDPEAGTRTPVDPGNYTWVLQAHLRDRPDVLEARIPITVD